MGLTVLDAGVVIAFLDADDAHHHAAREALIAATARHHAIALPASALAECLVGPARRGDDAVATVQAFVARLPIRIVPLDETIAEAAARLRARHTARLRLPDALVIATAGVLGADILLTTDRGWPRASALGLEGRILHV